MSTITIPAKKIERNHDNPDGRKYMSAPPANQTYDGEEFSSGGRT